jgi:hypothetical protein
MSWRSYQENVAGFFRSLGYTATVEAKVEGARGQHAIDGLVTFRKHNFDCKWVVECKDWDSAVPKEKVLALASIVMDVGADKGIIVSKSGFQSGAYSVANNTNILLTGLDELKASHDTELHEAFVDGLIAKYRAVEARIMAAYPVKLYSKGMLQYSVGGPKVEMMSRLWLLENGLKKLRAKRFPIPIDYNESGNYAHYATSIDGFIDAMNKHLEFIENAILCAEKSH